MCRSVSLCAEALSKLQAGKMQKPAERHIGHFQLFTIRAVTAMPRHMKKPPRESEAVFLCWHYLSSRQVTLQVLSAQTSLTSVFGMGTGGPSSQSIPTMSDGFAPSLLCQNLSQVLTALSLALGDPYRIRTDVKGVRGLCLNHLTNGPLVHLHGLEPGTH